MRLVRTGFGQVSRSNSPVRSTRSASRRRECGRSGGCPAGKGERDSAPMARSGAAKVSTPRSRTARLTSTPTMCSSIPSSATLLVSTVTTGPRRLLWAGPRMLPEPLTFQARGSVARRSPSKSSPVPTQQWTSTGSRCLLSLMGDERFGSCGLRGEGICKGRGGWYTMPLCINPSTLLPKE